MKRMLATIALAILIALAYTVKVGAVDEYISNIPVPIEVSLSVQNDGYIIYSIKEESGHYVAKLARDSEPHRYFVKYITFRKDFSIVSQTGLRSPNPPKPKEEKPKPPKPEQPPAIKPPEEDRNEDEDDRDDGDRDDGRDEDDQDEEGEQDEDDQGDDEEDSE